MKSNQTQYSKHSKRNAESLLPDTEPAEDPIEQIVRVDRSHHRPKFLERPTQFDGQDLRRVRVEHAAVRRAQMSQAGVDVVPAATEAGSQRRVTARASLLQQEFPQFREPLARR